MKKKQVLCLCLHLRCYAMLLVSILKLLFLYAHHMKDVVLGDRIINHVAGQLNPVTLAMHMTNVNIMLLSQQSEALIASARETQKIIERNITNFRDVAHRYAEASGHVNDLLQDPGELENLAHKYGAENFPRIKACAEEFFDAALDLMTVLISVTPLNATHHWAQGKLSELQKFPRLINATDNMTAAEPFPSAPDSRS